MFRCSYGLLNDGMRHSRTGRRPRRRFFALRYGFKYVSRPGDMRQIDLGLDFIFATARSRCGLGGRRLSFGCVEMHPHLLRFMLFQRTGMRLFFGHSDLQQHVENGLTFDFQFPGKIVDSNLTHPAFLLSPRHIQVFIGTSRSQLLHFARRRTRPA
jgi:hypothetical protein